MFVGIVYVTICSGALCRLIHGDEIEIVARHTRFKTIDECLSVTELASQWTIGDDYHWRVVCKKDEDLK